MNSVISNDLTHMVNFSTGIPDWIKLSDSRSQITNRVLYVPSQNGTSSTLSRTINNAYVKEKTNKKRMKKESNFWN